MIRDAARLDALLATLRAFVRDECFPMEARIDREDAIPEPLVERMRALGLFGHSIPEAYGGAGLTTEELARVNIEVSQAAPVFRARFGGNTGIASEALIADGLPEQKRQWLPKLASGEITGCFALTEPEAGSDATALRTRAVPSLGPGGRGGWRIDGRKCYITNAPIADLFTVFARTDDAPRGASGITAFLMPRGTPGLSTGPAYRKLGQHGSPVGEVILENVWVSDDAVLGGRPGEGFRSAMRALNKQRINLAGLCVGPAIRLLDEAIAHARTRRQFGQPIGEFQLVQAMIADSATEIAAARALVLETARKRDAGEDVTMDVSMCKLLASETCGRVADRAVQILGGAGYVEDHAIVRLYRDVRLFRLYEGTSQIHQVSIAKHLLRGHA
ncbi:MAG: acyl-CoA dehydrogenase family protein [Burkholderiaceae bacterium]|nr:acyl-CoA dehydrogenase family protein [Burkholderiales bacterium]MCZ8340277.1 acyl-CoA dehydrogenase family protein [Burkholderiaceae bacterium]